MLIMLDKGQSQYNIEKYSHNSIIINKVSYSNTFLLMPDKIFPNWGPSHIDKLTSNDILTIIELKPEIVLIGTGKSHCIVQPTLLLELRSKGIGVEMMNNQAACHTHTILAAEKRRVATLLIFDQPLAREDTHDND